MRILGVDPGGSGALALLDGTELIQVDDMPVFEVKRGTGFTKELNVQALLMLLDRMKPDTCWFEKVGPRETDSNKSAFSFGRVAGMCEGVIRGRGIPFRDVPPATWKVKMRLVHQAKDDARFMAQSRWPAMAGQFSRKKDDGRAEAALIADYGRQVMALEGFFG